MASCYDCDLPYDQDDGFEDFVVQNHIWEKISPTGDEGGILCANCICRRLTKAGISGVPGAYMSGPIDTVSEHVMEALLIAENCWERVQNFPKQTWFHLNDEEPE